MSPMASSKEGGQGSAGGEAHWPGRQMRRNLRGLDGRDLGDIGQVGGKAANLMAIAAAGFPVPDGFVVPVSVYLKFLEKFELTGQIRSALESADYDDEDDLSVRSGRIRDLILSAEVEPFVRSEFGDDRERMKEDSLWAVRSSAVAEDTAEASFAGQQDTYLNVAPDQVPEMVKRCWASYYNQRAIAYRHDAGISQTSGGIAVIVQRMVDARSSGVMFTADPLNKQREGLIIESSWGLGESMASGLVTPDRFVMDRSSGKAVHRAINRKLKEIRLTDGPTTSVDVDQARQVQPSLSDAEAGQLCDLGLRLERHFGAPQDVEWAVEGDQIFLLQSRPITTLTGDEDLLWTRGYGDEYWSDVTSPLFYSIMGENLTEQVNHEGAKIMGYWDLTDGELLRLHKGHVYFSTKVLESVFTYNPKFSRTKDLLNYFPKKDQARIANAETKVFRRIWAEVRIALNDPDGMINRNYKAYEKWSVGFLEKMRPFDALDLTRLSDAQLLDQFHQMEAAYLKHYRLIRYGMVTHSIGMNLVIKGWLTSWLNDKNGELYSKLISGLSNNKTIETNIELARLTQTLKQNEKSLALLRSSSPDEFLRLMRSGQLANGFTQDFERFMQTYGVRSHTRELFYPRWCDDPTLVVTIIQALAEAEDIDFAAIERGKIEERERTEKEVFRRIKKMKGGVARKFVFKTILGYAQIYLVFRENQRFYLDHILWRTRRLFMEYGRRFAERGWTDRTDDIFFLTKKEIFAISASGKTDVKGQIAVRRREFERYRNRLPPKFLRGKIEFDDPVAPREGGLRITGTSSSPGVAKGVIRVIESIEHLSEIRENEILVTSNTDPGWTAVYSKLGGLITETGGILSHGAVVSREYGIPAVTAVRGATEILKTGQRVTLDGNEGVVYLEEM
jgi:phosphohistidine swiveling domain-containing protein